jgi:methionine synthase II (cobalamin-independent)
MKTFPGIDEYFKSIKKDIIKLDKQSKKKLKEYILNKKTTTMEEKLILGLIETIEKTIENIKKNEENLNEILELLKKEK